MADGPFDLLAVAILSIGSLVFSLIAMPVSYLIALVLFGLIRLVTALSDSVDPR